MASRVQSANSSDSDVATIAYGSNVVAGNLGLLTTRIASSGSNGTVTDTRGSTWALVRRIAGGAANFNLEMWWTVFGSSGANTVTLGGGAIGRVQIEEATGLGAGATLDQQIGAAATSAAADSGAITASANTWAYASLGMEFYPSVIVTAGSGWSLVYNGTNKYAAEDRDFPAGGSLSGVFTLPESNNWAAIVASFKPAVSTIWPQFYRRRPVQVNL